MAPKTYCDDSGMAVANSDMGDMFLFAARSGGNAQVLAFTPGHIKRVIQMLEHNVKEYESRKGVIKVQDWTPGMKAPFQVEDLKGK
ncbi:MAG: hypothetical protein ACREGR_03355 [Minisyncoccia bacterium]